MKYLLPGDVILADRGGGGGGDIGDSGAHFGVTVEIAFTKGKKQG